MLIETGFFNETGSPSLKFRLAGALKEPRSRVGIDYEAVVDTGFMGFVSMPMNEAFPLGLLLTGLVDVVLADGSKRERLSALGAATFGGSTRWGPVILVPGSEEYLVGMKFLKAFSLTLVVNDEEVLLISEAGNWLDGLRTPTKAGRSVREPPPPAYWQPTAVAVSTDTLDAPPRLLP